MNGTSHSHTLAIDFKPPITTMAVKTASTTPVTCTFTPKVLAARVEIEFACTMFPIPNDATTVSSAKSIPSHFKPRPFSSAYIGPPSIVPSAVLTRYFTARSASLYFVAIPSTPVSHIQSTAPGPPRLTAVATPTMLPVPIVAASAVVNAANGLTSPAPPLLGRHRQLDRGDQVALHERRADRQKDVRAEEQDEERRPPHEGVGRGNPSVEGIDHIGVISERRTCSVILARWARFP